MLLLVESSTKRSHHSLPTQEQNYTIHQCFCSSETHGSWPNITCFVWHDKNILSCLILNSTSNLFNQTPLHACVVDMYLGCVADKAATDCNADIQLIVPLTKENIDIDLLLSWSLAKYLKKTNELLILNNIANKSVESSKGGSTWWQPVISSRISHVLTVCSHYCAIFRLLHPIQA